MTGKPVADERDAMLGKASRKWHAIFARLHREDPSLPIDKVFGALQAIHDGRFVDPVDGAVAALVAPQRPQLVHGRYNPIDVQVRNLWKWNRRFGWNLPKGWNDRLDVPEWSDNPLVSVNVVAYLEAKNGVRGEHRTFDAYWEIIRRQHPSHRRNDGLRAEEGRLQLLPGIEHVPGVRIEVIDHAANWDTSTGIRPMDVRNPETAPHAGLLASMAHHPKRVRMMNGTTVPFEWIAGYQATLPGRDPWRRVPFVDWNRGERWVGLSSNWGGCRGPYYSVPVRLPPAPRES